MQCLLVEMGLDFYSMIKEPSLEDTKLKNYFEFQLTASNNLAVALAKKKLTQELTQQYGHEAAELVLKNRTF